MALDTALRRLKQADDARPGFTGEHWLALGAGIALLFFAGRSRSSIVRSIVRTAATGMIARAASGRDGVRSVLR